MVSRNAVLKLDHTEVEYTFEVPLLYLLDARNEVQGFREIDGRQLPMVEFHWQGERIWGSTAFMIVELRKILLNQ